MNFLVEELQALFTKITKVLCENNPRKQGLTDDQLIQEAPAVPFERVEEAMIYTVNSPNRLAIWLGIYGCIQETCRHTDTPQEPLSRKDDTQEIKPNGCQRCIEKSLQRLIQDIGHKQQNSMDGRSESLRSR